MIEDKEDKEENDNINTDPNANGEYLKEESQSLLKPIEIPIQFHLNYIDTIIEQFTFSKYHLSTLIVCMLSMFLSGYSTSHFIFNKTLFLRQYSWTNTHFSIIFVCQNLICAIGAFISVTSTTLEWDIYSNSLIALTSFSALMFLHFFNEAPAFIFLSLIFYFCQGFINNICCNFLLEEFKLKYKELAFLFVSSFRLVGCGFFGLVAYVAFDLYSISNPITMMIGMTLFQLLLAISLVFFYESPRLLFCNNQIGLLYDYIEEAMPSQTRSETVKYKRRIVNNLLKAKEEYDNEIGNQEYRGIFLNFAELWKGRHLYISLKSIVFVFLSTFLMSNIKDCYSFFLSETNKSKDLFIIVEKTKPHYKIVIYYLIIFGLVMLMTGLKFIFAISRRILSIGCLVFCFGWIVLLFVFTEHFLYFLGLFEAFASFYYMMTYMYFSTYTTTKLRNSMTSLMFLTLSASMIFQCVLLVSIDNYSIFAYLNCIIILVLIVLDFVLIRDDTKDLKLQQIEYIILGKEPNTNANTNNDNGSGNEEH